MNWLQFLSVRLPGERSVDGKPPAVKVVRRLCHYNGKVGVRVGKYVNMYRRMEALHLIWVTS